MVPGGSVFLIILVSIFGNPLLLEDFNIRFVIIHPFSKFPEREFVDREADMTKLAVN